MSSNHVTSKIGKKGHLNLSSCSRLRFHLLAFRLAYHEASHVLLRSGPALDDLLLKLLDGGSAASLLDILTHQARNLGVRKRVSLDEIRKT